MPTLRFRLLEKPQSSRSNGFMPMFDYDGSGNIIKTRGDCIPSTRAFSFSENRRTHGQQNTTPTLDSMGMPREYNSSAHTTMKPVLAQERGTSRFLICPTCNSKCKNLYINPGVCKHQYCLEGCVRENLMGLKNKDGLYPKGCPICMCYPSSSKMCYADLLRVSKLCVQVIRAFFVAERIPRPTVILFYTGSSFYRKKPKIHGNEI